MFLFAAVKALRSGLIFLSDEHRSYRFKGFKEPSSQGFVCLFCFFVHSQCVHPINHQECAVFLEFKKKMHKSLNSPGTVANKTSIFHRVPRNQHAILVQ